MAQRFTVTDLLVFLSWMLIEWFVLLLWNNSQSCCWNQKFSLLISSCSDSWDVFISIHERRILSADLDTVSDVSHSLPLEETKLPEDEGDDDDDKKTCHDAHHHHPDWNIGHPSLWQTIRKCHHTETRTLSTQLWWLVDCVISDWLIGYLTVVSSSPLCCWLSTSGFISSLALALITTLSTWG